MDIQRLRNLTTGKLHTKMSHIYEDIEFFTGDKGIMTHQLPNACKALIPYLRNNCRDERLWDGLYDPSHTGNIDVAPMTGKDKEDFLSRYSSLPSHFYV